MENIDTLKKNPAANENFPSGSQVSVRAVREFDGMDEASTLIETLTEFDALF